MGAGIQSRPEDPWGGAKKKKKKKKQRSWIYFSKEGNIYIDVQQAYEKMFNITKSGKCKSKPQRHITSHLLQWLLWKRQKKKKIVLEMKGTLVHFWWECKLVKLLGKMVQRFFKKLRIEWSYDPAMPINEYLSKYQNNNLKRYMHPNVHHSSIHNRQDMETI